MKLLKKPIILEFDLTNNEGRLKLFIFVSGVAVFFAGVIATGVQITSYPQFCITCHEMRPEYVTWKASSHSQFKCAVCHLESGLKNQLVHKAGAVTSIWKHITKSYDLPIGLAEPIKDRTCLECHTEMRVTTATGDLIFPHLKHKQAKVPCVECHKGVAHGNIEERGMTMIEPDFTKWTEPVGQAHMQPSYSQKTMDECMSCHQENDVTIECEVCHTKNVLPANHKDPNWRRTHGQRARENLEGCDKCHSYAMFNKINGQSSSSNQLDIRGKRISEIALASVRTKKNIEGDYARRNSLCKGCHITAIPSDHNEFWRRNHGTEAKKDKQGCMVCHNEAGSGGGDAAKSTCLSCHSNKHKDSNTAEKHGVDYKQLKLEKQCFQCHPKKSCGECHYIN